MDEDIAYVSRIFVRLRPVPMLTRYHAALLLSKYNTNGEPRSGKETSQSSVSTTCRQLGSAREMHCSSQRDVF